VHNTADQMQSRITKIIFLLFFATTTLHAQNAEVEKLMEGDLKMTYPCIYFVHNSTDYAPMPYPVDTCYKYIASHIKYLNSIVIWRDSSETEYLTESRIKKIKLDLNKYTAFGNVDIESMENEQKISQRTIRKATNDKQLQYLLSFNSVLDVSGAIRHRKRWRRTHTQGRIFCIQCWRRGAFSRKKVKKKPGLITK
jgi:hypothetical protein